MNRMKRTTVALAAALLLGGTTPAVARADTSGELQAQIDQAQARLAELYAHAEDVSGELNRTLDDLAFTEAGIDETQAQIAKEQSELADAQQTLGRTVATQYKNGTTSLLSIALSSASFEDFVSRIYYLNKVNDAYRKQIGDVRALARDLAQKEAALEDQRAALESLRDEQEADFARLAASTAEVESYVAGLSAELQEALAAEAEAQAQAAREQAARELEAAGGSAEAGAADAADDTEASRPADAAEQPAEEGPAEEGPSEEQAPKSEDDDRQEAEAPPASGPSSMDARTAVVNYVLAQIGKPYVWATHGPDSFDCSGLTGAAYQQIGYFVGYSDSYQAQYCNKPASEAVYGDIVWRPGHVGICIGGGVTVEAHNPAMGIGYGSVSNFQRSGSPLG